ncbi:MAG: hypothetical protein ACF8R7_14730 [Phycisphaerales bacterium JB039]
MTARLIRTVTLDPAGQPERDPRISAELEDGEQLIWAARPLPRLMSRRAWPIAIFGVPFLGFAIFWTVGAAWGISQAGSAGNGPPGFAIIFPLFGLPFILVGLGLVTAPFWSRRAARKTLYALTDRRAILWEGGFRGQKVTSFGPEILDEMSRTQRDDGSGDLIFRQREVYTGSDRRSRAKSEGFLAVHAVRDLEKLVRQTIERAEQ